MELLGLAPLHDLDVNAAVNVLVYARKDSGQDMESFAPAEVLRRPVELQLLAAHSLPLTTSWCGELGWVPIF